MSSPPEEASGGPRGPLAGITVVDLSWHLAGPFCTLILADLGARVIKIEAPGSHGGYDPGGFVRHYFKGQDAHYMALNRNKLSVTLDLKSPEGKELFKLLCSRADVVFNNFRAGVMARLGIGYEQIREVAPDVVFASLSSFGSDGPYARRPGVDLVVQALSGGMSMTAEPGRPPVRAGIPVGDLAGGMWAAIAILATLRARRAGLSPGCELDLALLDGQIALTSYLAAQYFLDSSVAPRDVVGEAQEGRAFRCADDRYVVVVGDDAALRRAFGEPDDVPGGAREGRGRAETAESGSTPDSLVTMFASRPSAYWLERLERDQLPHARVNRLDEALCEPQVLDRGMVVEIEHRLGGRLRFVGSPIRLPGFRVPVDSPPLIGQDTEEILRELGLDRSETDRLKAEGVVS